MRVKIYKQGCLFDTTINNQEEKKMKTILFQGDSITDTGRESKDNPN